MLGKSFLPLPPPLLFPLIRRYLPTYTSLLTDGRGRARKLIPTLPLLSFSLLPPSHLPSRFLFEVQSIRNNLGSGVISRVAGSTRVRAGGPTIESSFFLRENKEKLDSVISFSPAPSFCLSSQQFSLESRLFRAAYEVACLRWCSLR